MLLVCTKYYHKHTGVFLSFMSQIAVIKTGGKQYKVKEGDVIKIEKLPEESGSKLDFSEVLLVADSKSGDTKLGDPFVSGAKVSAEIVEQGRDKKIKVVKYKPKTRYKTVRGHRQPFTRVRITGISS